jgi:DNA-binding CsgD family transcriptional regulator
MNIAGFFRNWLFPRPQNRHFHLDADLQVSLQSLADKRHSTPQAVMNDLVQQAIVFEEMEQETWKKWRSLTPREQEVTSLICKGYSSIAMSEYLNIASETVRSHVRNILGKFSVTSRQELRQLLEQWDFSSWT